MRRQKILSAVMTIVLLLFAVGCQPGLNLSTSDMKTQASEATSRNQKTEKTEPSKSSHETITFSGQGNSSANIMNGGVIAKADGWFYFHNVYDQFFLYKMKEDGSSKTKLSEDNPWNINVAGDWLFYTSQKEDYNLYRIKTDGSGREKLIDNYCRSVIVVDDWIYLIQHVLGSVYKLRMDGSELTCINDGSCDQLFYADDGLYYVNYSEGGKIYWMDMSGNHLKKVNDVKTEFYIVSEGWVYYKDEEDESLYRIRTDGSQCTKMVEGGGDFQSINCLDDWIYYPLGYLYRIKSDGSENTKISDDVHVTHIHVFDRWIYYYDPITDSFYRISPDGQKREKFGA